MIRRAASLAVTLAGALVLAACAMEEGGPRGPGGMHLKLVANPGEVVATELAFARTAQEKGQWTAFSEYAAEDAVMFVPQPVKAQEWLRGRANPPAAVRWQPHQVWSSCDGSLAVTKGAWQRADGTTGTFTTVWQRQANGTYRWVLDQGDALDQPLAEPEMIGADVADCVKVDGDFTVADPVGANPLKSGGSGSEDKSLSWHYRVEADGSRAFVAMLWQDGMMRTVLTERTGPQAGE